MAVVGYGGALAFGPLFFAGALPAWMTEWVAWATVPAIALWLLLALLALVVTWRARASDARIDAGGLEILSGPHHGRRFGWDALREGVQLRREGERSLFVVGGEVLASTHDADEAASLASVASTLRAGGSDRIPDAPMGPDVSLCSSCGAPLVPADALLVTCRHCRAESPMPERVRHVVAAPGVAPRIERAVTELSMWPPARRVNGWLVASFVAGLVGWPFFSACALYVQAERPSVGLIGLSVLLACGASATTTFPFLLALGTGARRSFELLSARFAASAPPEPEAPHGCRHCGGPLPEPHGRSTTPAVARCAYCNATNVVGLGLAREARAARVDAESLEDLAAHRIALRRRRRARAVLPVVVLALGPYQFLDVMADLPCGGAAGSCGGANLGRFCVEGTETAVRCDGPRGCAREGLRVFCDQSVAAPGDVCVGPVDAAACTADGGAKLRCVGGRQEIASRCGGPLGCRVEEDRVTCDASVAAPGDACEGEVHACTEGGTALLLCDGSHFAMLHPTDGCHVEGGHVRWGGAYAVVGERCGGGVACTSDARLLRCVDGRLAPYVVCGGPSGCTADGPHHRCDQSLASAGDPCPGEGAACSLDRRSMLRCEGGVFVESRRCAGGCELEGDHLSCRTRR